MKIGILTHFHKSINYGGVLQAYALCKYLNNQGYDAFQILYSAKNTSLNNEKKNYKVILEKVKKCIRRKIYKKQNNEIKKRMEEIFYNFRQNIPCTKTEYSKDNIKDAYDEADIFIVGSDQVWNPKWYDSSYMLDFAKDKDKIAYAASLGTNCFTESTKQEFNKQLYGFKAISVRENTGIDLISSVYDGEVVTTLDPTLLLSVEDWNEVSSERIINEPYIFTYFLGDDKNLRRLAEQYSETKNLKLVTIPYLMGEYRACDDNISGKKMTYATPNDFISLIKHAECVMTDSFHAAVFSLLYHKEFFVFERYRAKSMSSRLYNLTDIFKCTDHFCDTKNKTTLDYIEKLDKVDYSKPFIKYEVLKDNSYKFLKRNLEQV